MIHLSRLAPSLAILCFFLLGSSTLNASSLAPDPWLGELDTLRISVASGFFGFAPIPELDDRELSKEIRRRAECAVLAAGLTVSSESKAFLNIDLRNDWDEKSRDLVAVSIAVDVRIPLGSMSDAPFERFTSIWDERSVELFPPSEARTEILETVGYLLGELYEDLSSFQPSSGETLTHSCW